MSFHLFRFPRYISSSEIVKPHLKLHARFGFWSMSMSNELQRLLCRDEANQAWNHKMFINFLFSYREIARAQIDTNEGNVSA